MKRDEWHGYGSDDDLKEAVRQHKDTSRLVRIKAAQSARALGRLNRILEIRARALDSIAAAEDALVELDRKQNDDKQ